MSATTHPGDEAPMLRRAAGTARGIAAAIPAWLIGLAGLIAAIDGTTLHWGLLQPLPSILPIDPDISEPATAWAVAIGLLGLAVGLARRKRIAWWLAVVVLGAALLVQVELLQHVGGAGLAAGCLAILVAVRGRFDVETSPRSRRSALALWGIAALMAVATLAASVGSALRLVSPGADAQSLASALASWLAFGDPGLAVRPHLHGVLLLGATLAARSALVAGVLLALAPREAPDRTSEGERRAARVASRYGQGALLPFQLGPEARRFSLPGVEAVIAYGLDGRVAVVLGDPIGPPPDAAIVLDEFLRTCARNDWIPAVYQASEEARAPLRERGYHAYPIGREAIIDLPAFSLAGARRANLRHTVTRSRRGGVTVEWHPDGLGPNLAGLSDALRGVNRAWRAAPRPALRFTVSAYRPADLVRNPVALARDASGTVVAYTTFRATGVDEGWCLDLLRRVPGSVPGAVEACLAAAAEGLRDRGARTLSLGLAPLAGLDARHGSPVERTLGAGTRLMRPIYDVAGLEFFKAKFDPRWETRYLAVAHRTQLPAVIFALLRLHVGGARGLVRDVRRAESAA